MIWSKKTEPIKSYKNNIMKKMSMICEDNSSTDCMDFSPSEQLRISHVRVASLTI